MVAFESVSTPLRFLHLLAAIATAGSAVHLLVRFILALRGRHGLFRIKRMHTRILLVSYGLTFLLGCVIYPTFRVRVRHDFLDAQVPLATALFEIKEHLAVLALLPVITLYWLSQSLDFRDPDDRRYLGLFSGLLFFVLAVIFFNSCVGWWIGTLRADYHAQF